jgi:flagellar secretion chaperone FliS
MRQTRSENREVPSFMFDPTATYRTAQVVSASKTDQIVLLYQGAIRFTLQHLTWLERKDVEQANRASLRAQEIVSALRGSLDLSAGPIAVQLEALYDFVLRRLLDGNMSKKPRPTEEAVQVLRGLLEAWQELAARPTAADLPEGTASAQRLAQLGIMSPAAQGGGVLVGGARR